MGRSFCKRFSKSDLITITLSIIAFVAAWALNPAVARADVFLSSIQASHYTETSWLPQYDDVVVTSKLTLEVMRAGPVHGYGGAVLEQDTRSNNQVIYNDNGVSPMVGAWMPLLLPELSLFTEYRQTFRVVNKPESRQGSQPDLLLGSYGYKYWSLASVSATSSLFQETYGDLIARSKLSYKATLESWSKTGMRWTLPRGFSADTYLDIEFRRAATGEAEDNFQTLGPGFRLNYFAQRFSASVGAHQELGSYTNRSDSISRWKTLLVISGAL
jgi:hypothetical protein